MLLTNRAAALYHGNQSLDQSSASNWCHGARWESFLAVTTVINAVSDKRFERVCIFETALGVQDASGFSCMRVFV